jgi:tellurite methyltransferase
MDIRGWEERYKSRERPSEDFLVAPTPLLVEVLERTAPGTALDLACGTGRNSLWLAQHGWRVTAVDGAPTSIDVLRGHASELGVEVDARVADLEKSEYAIESSTWDLIVIGYYLQRSLFEPAKRGVVPGGIVLAIVHITEPGEKPTEHRLTPGELASYFQGWEILHHHEGTPNDRAHRRSVAEIVALRPNLGSRDR